MATEFLRDGLFLLAWFGLMTMVWLGWAQEGPPERARPFLGIGSVIGVLAAIGGGILVARNWDTPSGLDGQYALFGVLVAVEVVAAGLVCLVLARRGLARWFAVGVAAVVALHFLPLAALLSDPALAVLGIVQLILVAIAARFAARHRLTPSFPIGVVMGATLLVAAVIAGARWLPDAL